LVIVYTILWLLFRLWSGVAGNW